jgi:SAM-dependent methyltransferase
VFSFSLHRPARPPLKSCLADHCSFREKRRCWKQSFSRSPASPRPRGGELILDQVLPYLKPGSKVLDLGCGASSIGLQLYRSSPVPVQVFCLDYSRAALASLKQLFIEKFRNSEKPKSSVHFVHGNATKMPFKPNTFDVILDKETTDSVLKFADKVQGGLMARRIQQEALRTIVPSGVYIQLAAEGPDSRLASLRDNTVGDSLAADCDFTIAYSQLGQEDAWQQFMYVLSLNRTCQTSILKMLE